MAVTSSVANEASFAASCALKAAPKPLSAGGMSSASAGLGGGGGGVVSTGAGAEAGGGGGGGGGGGWGCGSSPPHAARDSASVVVVRTAARMFERIEESSGRLASGRAARPGHGSVSAFLRFQPLGKTLARPRFRLARMLGSEACDRDH